jgi:hypothetical protein
VVGSYKIRYRIDEPGYLDETISVLKKKKRKSCDNQLRNLIKKQQRSTTNININKIHDKEPTARLESSFSITPVC